MKFVHMADIHFDTPFTVLGQRANLADRRRLEQRNVFSKIIEHIKYENIPYLFISGDLYDQQHARKSTIEFISDAFNTIPNTKIFISPGNHDPYIKNSFYNTFDWGNNVIIFTPEFEKYSDENIDVYGYGFPDFTCTEFDENKIEIANKNKINVLVIHGSLDASDKLELQYNPISKRVLREKGFDYIALGHIHKTNYRDNTNIVYPGSTISFGFDELGNHGIIAGDVEKGRLRLEFIKMDNRTFEEVEFDISTIDTSESLIETLDSLELERNSLYKILLTGTRNFELNLNNIEKLLMNDNILKLKDCTSLGYNLEELSRQNNIKGTFVNVMLQKLETGDYTAEEIEKAIEIGLNVL